MKHIIWQPPSEKWITDVAVCQKKRCRTWSRHILGWYHINFIKLKTYSALLPPKAYDSPHLLNECMRVTKYFLQCIFTYYDLCMTHFFTILCGLFAYICLPQHFSRSFKYNDLHLHTNIYIYIFIYRSIIRTSRIWMLNSTRRELNCNMQWSQINELQIT
jgi:hypothetical protein